MGSIDFSQERPALHRLARHEPRHDVPGLGHCPAEPHHPRGSAQAQPAALPLWHLHRCTTISVVISLARESLRAALPSCPGNLCTEVAGRKTSTGPEYYLSSVDALLDYPCALVPR